MCVYINYYYKCGMFLKYFMFMLLELDDIVKH